MMKRRGFLQALIGVGVIVSVPVSLRKTTVRGHLPPEKFVTKPKQYKAHVQLATQEQISASISCDKPMSPMKIKNSSLYGQLNEKLPSWVFS